MSWIGMMDLSFFGGFYDLRRISGREDLVSDNVTENLKTERATFAPMDGGVGN